MIARTGTVEGDVKPLVVVARRIVAAGNLNRAIGGARLLDRRGETRKQVQDEAARLMREAAHHRGQARAFLRRRRVALDATVRVAADVLGAAVRQRICEQAAFAIADGEGQLREEQHLAALERILRRGAGRVVERPGPIRQFECLDGFHDASSSKRASATPANR